MRQELNALLQVKVTGFGEKPLENVLALRLRDRAYRLDKHATVRSRGRARPEDAQL